MAAQPTWTTMGSGEAVNRASVGMTAGPPASSTSRAVPATSGTMLNAMRAAGTRQPRCRVVIGRRLGCGQEPLAP